MYNVVQVGKNGHLYVVTFISQYGAAIVTAILEASEINADAVHRDIHGSTGTQQGVVVPSWLIRFVLRLDVKVTSRSCTTTAPK